MTQPSPTPAGFTSTIELFGDSLTAGAGGSGQNLSTVLAALLPGRIVNNWGIGGQTAEQIAARQGGLQVTLTITGGSLPASFATAVVTPSTALLSTPSDNTTRYISGSINGAAATLIRAATGGPPSTTESYTIMAAGNPGATAIPSWAPFVSDQGANASDSIQVLWLGRNNAPALTATPALIQACVNSVPQPRRVLVIGILPALDEIPGTTNRIAIDAANASTISRVGSDVFIPSTPPTVAEMAAIGYSPTSQDNIDIGRGVFPTGMHADNVHLTGPGYSIFAMRVRDAILANNY